MCGGTANRMDIMSENFVEMHDTRRSGWWVRLASDIKKGLPSYLLGSVLPFLLLLFILILAWWAYVRWAKTIILPAPPDVLRALRAQAPGVLTEHLWYSLKRFGGGYLLGLALGAGLGVLISANRYVYNAFFPLLEFFRSLPATALFPFLLALLGDNDYSRTATAVYITVWITAFNVSQAILKVSSRRKEYLSAINARPWFVVRHLYFYELLPSFMSSARVTLPLTLLVMVAVEMIIGAKAGLGKAIFNAHYFQDYAGVAAVVIIVGLIGLLMNKAAQLIEGLFVFWKE